MIGKSLEDLLGTLRKRKNMTGTSIDQFNRLYQKAAQNLSYSQTYFPEEEVTDYLNGLVSKSHNLFYKDQITSGKQIRHFFSTTFIGLASRSMEIRCPGNGLVYDRCTGCLSFRRE